MELMRHSFADYSFRWPPCARRDICGRGERTAAFTPENRFGARATRGLRWSGSAVERLSVFGYGLAATARVLTVFVYVLTVFGYELAAMGARFDRIRVWISRHGARFDRIGVRFDRISARFDRIRVRFDRIRVRISRHGRAF